MTEVKNKLLDTYARLDEAVEDDDGDAHPDQKEAEQEDAAEFWSEGEIHRVRFWTEIKQLSKLDVIEQTFEIDATLFMSYLPSKEDIASFEENPQEFEPDFYPTFEIMNGCVDLEKTPEMVPKTSTSFQILEGYVFQKISVRGSLSEKLELENFPFDCQDLPILIEASDSEIDECVFVPFFEEDDSCSRLYLQTLKLPEWDVIHYLVEFTEFDYGEGSKFSRMILRCKARRRPGAYLKRVAFVMAVICISVLMAFAMDPVEDLSDRLAHCMTILLTATAFQFVARDTLPQVSYLTLMDKYIYFCFAFIFGVSVLIAIEGRDGVNFGFDNMSFFICVVIIVVGHVVFAIMSYQAMQEEQKKLVFCGDELDALEDMGEQTLAATRGYHYGNAFFETDVTEERIRQKLM